MSKSDLIQKASVIIGLLMTFCSCADDVETANGMQGGDDIIFCIENGSADGRYVSRGMAASDAGEELSSKTLSLHNGTTMKVDIFQRDMTAEDMPVLTRGATDNIAANGFGVFGSVYPKSQTYSSNPCNNYFSNILAQVGEPTSYLWPTDDYKLSFYGYYPHSSQAQNISVITENVSGNPIYRFTNTQNANDTKPLMTASVTDIVGGGINLL